MEEKIGLVTTDYFPSDHSQLSLSRSEAQKIPLGPRAQVSLASLSYPSSLSYGPVSKQLPTIYHRARHQLCLGWALSLTEPNRVYLFGTLLACSECTFVHSSVQASMSPLLPNIGFLIQKYTGYLHLHLDLSSLFQNQSSHRMMGF